MRPVDHYEISRNALKPAFCGAKLLSWSQPTSLSVLVWHPHTLIKHYYSYGAEWDVSIAGCSLSPVLLAGEFGMSWPLLASGFIWRCVYFLLALQYIYNHPAWCARNCTCIWIWWAACPGKGIAPAWPLPYPHARRHTLVSLSSCQVCSVCVWGRIAWVIILGMGNTGKFFLNRPFSELAELQGCPAPVQRAQPCWSFCIC